MRIKRLLVVVAAVAATAAFAATVPFASGATSKSVSVSAKTVPGLGPVLVNSAGRVLYMFVPDKDKKVTCFKVCAKIWPPLALPKGGKPVAAGAVKQSLLGSDPDASVAGGRVVTYKGWPLYLYLGDPKSGTANGQALDMNGGLWYVMAPSGAIIKHKASKGGGGGGGSTTTTTTTTTTAGGAPPPSQCDDADNDGDENAGGPDDGDGCL